MKPVKGKKKAKNKKKIQKSDSDCEIIEIQDHKSSQANKKQRISSTQSESDSEQHAPNDPQTVKKKPQRAAKTKAKSKLKYSSQHNSAESSTAFEIKPNNDKKQIDNMISNTPSLNRLRIEAIIESTKKPTKQTEPAKPVTRANNGKVKQAIEIFEQQMRTATKTTEKIPRVVSKTSQVRSSIDKRNLRSSQSKQQVKRKSVKNVSALIKSVKSDLNVTSTIKSSVSDQTIQEEETKSDENKRITRNILSSALVQQQYRVPNIFKSALKANGERKPSLLSSNFLDRNTPSKHTKTVTKYTIGLINL